MNRRRILVVDDDPDVREYFAAVLGDHGYEVTGAGTAAAAVDALERFCPDVVIVDVLLPGRSGLDLLVTLRRSPRWSATPLVVVTGVDRLLEDDCQSYLGSHPGVDGPDAVLGKPIDPATLLAVLRAIEGRTSQSPS